jgi:hypothetical protein
VTNSPLTPEVLSALATPGAHPRDPSAQGVEWIQTHLSHVFLTGERVYKFRKPVESRHSRSERRALRWGRWAKGWRQPAVRSPSTAS